MSLILSVIRPVQIRPWAPLIINRRNPWDYAFFYCLQPQGSAESAGDVIFGLLIGGGGKDLLSGAELNDMPLEKEGGEIGNPGRLLHVVRDDDDGVGAFQIVDQFFNPGSGDGIDGRGRLIHQQDLGFDGQGPGDTEALLPPPGEGRARLLQDVFHFVPEGRPAHGLLHPIGQLSPSQAEVHLQAVGHVIEDAHGKGRGLLEDHPHPPAQFHDVISRVQDILAVQQHLACGPLVAVKLIDAVIDADVGGLAAARGADDGSYPVGGDSRLLANKA